MSEEIKNEFIKQTAKDYDLDYEIIRWFYDKYGLNFYGKLEEYLSELTWKQA